MATPVALVPVLVVGHSSTTFAGIESVGLIVSLTVMVWTQLATLPQSSVAVQVRAINLVPPQLVVTASL